MNILQALQMCLEVLVAVLGMYLLIGVVYAGIFTASGIKLNGRGRVLSFLLAIVVWPGILGYVSGGSDG